MDDIGSSLLRGPAFSPLSFLLYLALGTLTLAFSMILASRLAGGIDFGPATTVIPRGAGLLAAVTAVNYLDCGLLLAGPLWLFGLMGLFGLDYRQARVLAQVNWAVNLLWKLLLAANKL
jgi:hypothetical protein